MKAFACAKQIGMLIRKLRGKSDTMIRTENGSKTTSSPSICCNMNDFSQTYQISWQTRHHKSSKTYMQCYKIHL